MPLAALWKSLRRKPVAYDKLSGAQIDEALERIAAKLRCFMFLYGLCLGVVGTTLYLHQAYGLLSFVIAFTVGWIAWHGWPWEL
jgi:hypothetical protein